ncbi:MAG: ABC transporter ATP-binding protein [Candidatus Marsarchaeota archaeon]|nr:ABC transporter ATP-binding protein [Candidatus Marsarchaeota archaeon]MCL5094739.1 ABC transporter ATP-binding protein [Candidatus Marsarchaeota archaeon]
MDILKINNISLIINESKILDNISFSCKKNEFISIIGPSGCGKSTLLRIIAGLVKPTNGTIIYKNRMIKEPISNISFVFQDFALLPWLTNIENIKLGLSRFKMSDDERAKKAKNLLNKLQLDHFANLYPNILSGGMKQRIGIARALISNPNILLMDEPFSALDQLTADTLRTDVLHMLRQKNISVNLVLLVSHNVEEVVTLSNKVVILSDKPSKIKQILEIDLNYPRNKRDEKFMDYVDKIYSILMRE